MTRQAILQIGTEKTGTTTLQTFLAANRDRLAERGFLYPRFCGEINHTGLAAYALDADRPDELKHPFGGLGPEDVPAMRARLERRAAAELTGAQTVIFCGEHCHSRLVTPGEVGRLRDFLAGFFDEVRISVYLRRQDQIALSLYSTKLKSGVVPERVLPVPARADPYFNYDRFLALWEDAFGREALTVRLFDRQSLVGGSIVDDFLATWAIGPGEAFRAVPNENGSVSIAAQEFLRLANPCLGEAASGADPALRGRIVAALSRLHPGRGARPARAEAMAFYEAYRESNAAVLRRHFPGRDRLFDEDFDGYPDLADDRGLDAAGAARVATALLLDRSREIVRLESEIAVRDAALHWRDDRPEAALQSLKTAIAVNPRHAGLHRALGEYLLRLQSVEASRDAAETACRLAPDSWEYRHFLGVVLMAAGDPLAAAEAQQAALVLNPGHPGAGQALAAALAACRERDRRTA